MEIDYNKLQRDYTNNPIKVGEDLIYKDVYYLFWELNLTKKQVAKIMGCSDNKIYNFTKTHGLIKTQQRITESQRNLLVDKYGCDNVMKVDYIKDKCTKKIQQTFKENKQQIIKQRIQTCNKKYQCNNPSQNDLIKAKKEETCYKNYGVKNPQQNKEIKNKTKITFNSRYNGKVFNKNSVLYESTKQTILENTGYENAMQNKNIANKVSQTHKNNQELYKQNNIEKYGVEYISQLPNTKYKIIQTKRANGTFNTSKPEEEVYQYLLSSFSSEDIVRQYRSDLYPFACDFYIKSLDLYMECNFCWTHGKEPFNSENMEHIKLLEEMKEKAKSSNFYENAISTWTQLDVKKLNTFKENNLNYLIFYSINDFLPWFDSIS